MRASNPEGNRMKQLEKLYGTAAQKAKLATRADILLHRTGREVATPTPARIQWLIADQGEDISFQRDESLPTEAQLREKQDADLATLVEEVFEETGIENTVLLTKLAKMPADIYEVFMAEWLELSEIYARDFDILIRIIDKNCVRADGTIRDVKLKRLIKVAKEKEIQMAEENEE